MGGLKALRSKDLRQVVAAAFGDWDIIARVADNYKKHIMDKVEQVKCSLSQYRSTQNTRRFPLPSRGY
jgi:hypothetical protein